MDNVIIDKKQAQRIMSEIAAETAKIRNAAQEYCSMVNEEYKELNLHFLKELLDMFGMDEKHNGIGLLAEQLDSIYEQVNETLEDYCTELGEV